MINMDKRLEKIIDEFYKDSLKAEKKRGKK